MSFYGDMADVALELLAEFGAAVSLPRGTGGQINPVTGEVYANTAVTTVTTTGLLRPYDDNMIDGARILAGDRELILSDEQAPTPSDKPTIGGDQWAIVSIKNIKPDGVTPVCYFVQVRR